MIKALVLSLDALLSDLIIYGNLETLSSHRRKSGGAFDRMIVSDGIPERIVPALDATVKVVAWRPAKAAACSMPACGDDVDCSFDDHLHVIGHRR
jgi:hypothetical protein